ncbi:MAG: nucleotidyltransferase domain-containing protein [Chromatiaceae bacterium]
MIHPKLTTILTELSEALRERLGVRFRGLWLYGSQARGDAGPESDIDLLLVLADPQRPALEIDRIVDILADFNLRYGVLLSVLPVAEPWLQEGSGPFWRQVRAEGVAA